MDNDYLYRFRNLRHLLDEPYSELEKQEIYFSDIESLNDPMEGIKEIYWDGDSITWKNLLKHYLLCLEQSVSLTYFLDQDKSMKSEEIPIFLWEENLPTIKYKNLYKEICTDFFTDEIELYIEAIANRTDAISQEELLFHLKLIHPFAIETITTIHEKNEFIPPSERTPCNMSSIEKITHTLSMLNQEENPELVKIFFSTVENTFDEMNQIAYYNLKNDVAKEKKYFILFDFPKLYLDQIKKLVYPPGYVACFMKECKDASLWAHYGDDHQGVCLVFKPSLVNGKTGLLLKGINAWSSSHGPSIGNIPLHFHRVKYEGTQPGINFFENIGRLPRIQLQNQWYSDDKGILSHHGRHFFDNDAKSKWRKIYWKNFEQVYTIKSKDWKKEKEFRLLFPDFMGWHKEIDSRKMKYNFDSLQGVIFGYRTPKEERDRIIRIIEQKCTENKTTNFKFHQAKFLSGKLEIIEMSGIKII